MTCEWLGDSPRLFGEAVVLLGHLVGMVSAVALAIPLWDELKHRRHFEYLSKLRTTQAAIATESEEFNKDTWRAIQFELLESRLGDYSRQKVITLAGTLFLVVAFVMLTIGGSIILFCH